MAAYREHVFGAWCRGKDTVNPMPRASSVFALVHRGPGFGIYPASGYQVMTSLPNSWSLSSVGNALLLQKLLRTSCDVIRPFCTLPLHPLQTFPSVRAFTSPLPPTSPSLIKKPEIESPYSEVSAKGRVPASGGLGQHWLLREGGHRNRAPVLLSKCPRRMTSRGRVAAQLCHSYLSHLFPGF